MTRSEKIAKAKKLTEMNQEESRIHLIHGFLEGTPQVVEHELKRQKMGCKYLKKHKNHSQIWYINRQGIAEVI